MRLALVDNKFIVKDAHLQHENHLTDKVTYAHYAENLRLTPSQQLEAKRMISVGANKKLIKMMLMKETNKPVQLKTLHNVQTKMLLEKQSGELTKLCNILENIPNARVKIITNQENELLGKLV